MLGTTAADWATWLGIFGFGLAVGAFGWDQWQRHQDTEADFDATHVRFGGWLAPVPQGSPGQEHAGLHVENWGPAVWVHDVRLSWRYLDDGAWQGADLECRLRDGRRWPVPFPGGEELDMIWPGTAPPRRGDLVWDANITWGRSRKGRTRVAHLDSGGDEGAPTNWGG